LADYPLGSLGIQIREHWKRHRPQMYAELENSGHLTESLHAAQERTSELMASLLAAGMPHHQAWELAREEWAFLPDEEDDEGAEDPAHDLRDDARPLPPAVGGGEVEPALAEA
jgi:hypothetical protein